MKMKIEDNQNILVWVQGCFLVVGVGALTMIFLNCYFSSLQKHFFMPIGKFSYQNCLWLKNEQSLSINED